MLEKIIYYSTVLSTTVFTELLMTEETDSSRFGWFLAAAAVFVIVVGLMLQLKLMGPRDKKG